MALLTLDSVWKRFAQSDRGVRERVALRDVTLQLETGELVAILGRRGAGRTTLLQVAAGIEQPTSGSVRFAGEDLREHPMIGRPDGLGYCTTAFAHVIGETIIEHVAAPLLSGRVSTMQAQARAHEVLRRVGASHCAEVKPAALDAAETVRVAIARALIPAPRLLIVDEPTIGVRLRERDQLLELIRSVAHDDGIAVLMTVDDATGLAGADRALSLDGGELRGELLPSSAAVVPLHGSRAGSSA